MATRNMEVNDVTEFDEPVTTVKKEAKHSTAYPRAIIATKHLLPDNNTKEEDIKDDDEDEISLEGCKIDAQILRSHCMMTEESMKIVPAKKQFNHRSPAISQYYSGGNQKNRSFEVNNNFCNKLFQKKKSEPQQKQNTPPKINKLLKEEIKKHMLKISQNNSAFSFEMLGKLMNSLGTYRIIFDPDKKIFLTEDGKLNSEPKFTSNYFGDRLKKEQEMQMLLWKILESNNEIKFDPLLNTLTKLNSTKKNSKEIITKEAIGKLYFSINRPNSFPKRIKIQARN